jgi:tRNA 2-thiouridine synthesizing protein E
MNATHVHPTPAPALQGLPLDDAGFLVDQRHWSPAVAEALAMQAGLAGLDQMHWRIIDFVRDRYLRFGAMPPMRHVCRKLGIGRNEVKQVFGTCRSLWQIAGLPNPGDEALSYMD